MNLTCENKETLWIRLNNLMGRIFMQENQI